MYVRQLHQWITDPAEAQQLQRELSKQVILHDVPPDLANPGSGAVHLIAGCDLSFQGETGRAVVVILSFPDLVPQHVEKAEIALTMPYIPGLLSFREVPVYIEAFKQLPDQYAPDLVMMDGQGIAHPRRLGLASHMGLILDLPTIGVAKSRLVGTYTEPGPNPGDYTLLMDKGELIGVVVRTKKNTKPLFISPGNKIDVPTSRDYVLRCCRGYRLPEPTRLAHLAAAGNDILKAAKPTPSQQSFFDTFSR